MKLHLLLGQAVVEALRSIFNDGSYADKALERIFKANRKLGARDRRFIAESTYDLVRWWRFAWFCLGKDPLLDQASLFQLLGTWLIIQNVELPDWREVKGLNAVEIRNRAREAKANPAVKASLPDWLYELGLHELGENWPKILPALNETAPAILRANRLKTTREDLQKQLLAEQVATEIIPQIPDGLKLSERKNLFSHQSFQLGLFEMQDGASQQVAPLLAPEPGHRVIDGCAGAGGKTLHLAALMRNKGKIIALDIYDRKLQELRKRSARAGCDIIEVKLIDSNKVIKRLEKSADRVLLDVPCSGLGVLRRNPDTKWKLTPEEILRLNELQSFILSSYSEMCKPGGRLVYATCSILPSENEKQVEKFLNEQPGWKLIEEKKFFPGEYGFDGFYAAALERANR